MYKVLFDLELGEQTLKYHIQCTYYASRGRVTFYSQRMIQVGIALALRKCAQDFHRLANAVELSVAQDILCSSIEYTKLNLQSVPLKVEYMHSRISDFLVGNALFLLVSPFTVLYNERAFW